MPVSGEAPGRAHDAHNSPGHRNQWKISVNISAEGGRGGPAHVTAAKALQKPGQLRARAGPGAAAQGTAGLPQGKGTELLTAH